MDEENILDKLLEKQNGYIRLIDAQNEGVSKYTVMEYVRKNEMEKLAPGVYISSDAWEDRLYLLQLRNRKIVFSHESALYMHNLSDRERCICDIIKNKNKMDIQVFQMALTSYFTDGDKNIHNLMKYSEIMGISDKVRQYTEVLL